MKINTDSDKIRIVVLLYHNNLIFFNLVKEIVAKWENTAPVQNIEQ